MKTHSDSRLQDFPSINNIQYENHNEVNRHSSAISSLEQLLEMKGGNVKVFRIVLYLVHSLSTLLSTNKDHIRPKLLWKLFLK